jgi:hypothetical protein
MVALLLEFQGKGLLRQAGLPVLRGRSGWSSPSSAKSRSTAAGVIAIDAPFVAYQDMEAFETNGRDGCQMGYEGR